MRPGWPVLRKRWHIETTPFKKFMSNLRKWKKLTLVPRFSTSTVKPKSYGDKTQLSFVRETCVAFFPTWSLNFQIAETCMHCVPIFYVRRWSGPVSSRQGNESDRILRSFPYQVFLQLACWLSYGWFTWMSGTIIIFSSIKVRSVFVNSLHA